MKKAQRNLIIMLVVVGLGIFLIARNKDKFQAEIEKKEKTMNSIYMIGGLVAIVVGLYLGFKKMY